MPVYEYKCTKCSTKFDRRRGFHETAEEECPVCSSEAQRVFSPVPIVFKGSGFYVTDSKSKNSASSGNSDNGEKPSTPEKTPESSSEKKSETTSETKSETKIEAAS
jgi:putative FmdB family regulatory protein